MSNIPSANMFLTPFGAHFSIREYLISNSRTCAVLDAKICLECTAAELKCLESSHKRLNQVMKILHRPLHSAREGFRCGQQLPTVPQRVVTLFRNHSGKATLVFGLMKTYQGLTSSGVQNKSKINGQVSLLFAFSHLSACLITIQNRASIHL
jgi:hypothetical protein